MLFKHFRLFDLGFGSGQIIPGCIGFGLDTVFALKFCAESIQILEDLELITGLNIPINDNIPGFPVDFNCFNPGTCCSCLNELIQDDPLSAGDLNHPDSLLLNESLLELLNDGATFPDPMFELPNTDTGFFTGFSFSCTSDELLERN